MNVFLNVSGFDADGKIDYHGISEGGAGCECHWCESCDQDLLGDAPMDFEFFGFCMMPATKNIRINNEYCYVCKECWFEHKNGGEAD